MPMWPVDREDRCVTNVYIALQAKHVKDVIDNFMLCKNNKYDSHTFIEYSQEVYGQSQFIIIGQYKANIWCKTLKNEDY